jgi:hypothetical protein
MYRVHLYYMYALDPLSIDTGRKTLASETHLELPEYLLR